MNDAAKKINNNNNTVPPGLIGRVMSIAGLPERDCDKVREARESHVENMI